MASKQSKKWLCYIANFTPEAISSIMTIVKMAKIFHLGVSFTLHFHKKITEFSVVFLQNGILILSWIKYKAAGAICFEIMIPRKKNKELIWKVPSKVYGSNFIMENKTKTFFGLLIILIIINEKWLTFSWKFKVYRRLYSRDLLSIVALLADC